MTMIIIIIILDKGFRESCPYLFMFSYLTYFLDFACTTRVNIETPQFDH